MMRTSTYNVSLQKDHVSRANFTLTQITHFETKLILRTLQIFICYVFYTQHRSIENFIRAFIK